jgi:4'-phosphopantetheinyl transferase EntD
MAGGGCVIEAILPDAVIAVEAREDPSGIVLFPAEEAAIGRAVEKRRREFTTARACAREALSRLGLPASAVTNGARGEPRWPAGVVGSITHCEGYRACAIARSTDMATIGIDAEPHAALPEGVLSDIAGAQELSWLSARRHEFPGVHWDRLLFSAKESVYKAWFPLAKRWLGFEDALVTVNASAETFAAGLLVPGPPVDGRRLTGFSGRWLVRDGLVLTAIALPAGPASPEALNPSSADPPPTR